MKAGSGDSDSTNRNGNDARNNSRNNCLEYHFGRKTRGRSTTK